MAKQRTSRRIVAVLLAAGCWLVAAVFVRVSLDWSDTQPYAGSATEIRYLVFAGVAVAIAAGGTIAGIVMWRRGRRR